MDWSQTRRSADFLDHWFPEMVRQISRLADAVEKNNAVALQLLAVQQETVAVTKEMMEHQKKVHDLMMMTQVFVPEESTIDLEALMNGSEPVEGQKELLDRKQQLEEELEDLRADLQAVHFDIEHGIRSYSPVYINDLMTQIADKHRALHCVIKKLNQ